MEQLNRYYRRSKISERKMRQIIRCFALDLIAAKTAELVGLTRKSVNQIYLKMRRRITEECERASPFGGVVEVDESYFGAKRVRGKRGRGASGKTIVFGIFKRNGSVYTEIVSTAARKRCKPLFAGASEPKRSFTRTAGAATTDLLMLDTRNIFASIILRISLSTAVITSTVLRAFGHQQNAACKSSTDCRRTLFIYI
jgi:hypothetical protein